MSTTFNLYNSFLKYLQDGTVNLKDDTIKLALVTNLYSYSVEHDVLADVLGSPSCEVEQIDSPDNGYTTGARRWQARRSRSRIPRSFRYSTRRTSNGRN